jgi:hypothetical protein
MRGRILSSIACLLLLSIPAAANAQDATGSDLARVGGGVLGVYSGVVLGTAGSLIPCTQTLAGVKCVRVAAIFGGLVGMAAGIHMGAGDEDAVVSTYRGAAYGAMIGGVVGFALKEAIPPYGWIDVATAAGIGAAIGTAPVGAVLGFAGGLAVGSILLITVPSFETADAVGMGFLGMAVGGLAGWVIRSIDAHENDPTIQIVLPLRVGF